MAARTFMREQPLITGREATKREGEHVMFYLWGSFYTVG